MTGARDQTERAADRIRSELMSTLQELDRRRHLVLDLRYQARQHFTATMILTAGALVATGAGVTIAIVRARHRRANLFSERIAGLLRAWENPNRIASPATSPRLLTEVARNLAVALAAALAAQLVRRSVRRLLASDSRWEVDKSPARSVG